VVGDINKVVDEMQEKADELVEDAQIYQIQLIEEMKRRKKQMEISEIFNKKINYDIR
jgi:hypothetical protein